MEMKLHLRRIGTFLEDLCAVHLDQAQVGILVFFAVTHAGRDLVWRMFVIGLVAVWPSSLQNHHVDTLGSGIAEVIVCGHVIRANLPRMARPPWIDL